MEIGWSIMAKRVNNGPVPVGARRAYLLITENEMNASHPVESRAQR
ncbi:hypothetical protein VW39_001799 [Salmonella enterica subsp. houtenae]|nr:hypothetical protein [Salmonella enterica subsp. houtenae]